MSAVHLAWLVMVTLRERQGLLPNFLYSSNLLDFNVSTGKEAPCYATEV